MSCRVFPLLDVIGPGATGTARIELARPLALQHGDRLVLRESGRRATIAGGSVLDPGPPPRARGVLARLKRVEVLELLEQARDDGKRVHAAVVAHGRIRATGDALATMGLASVLGSADVVEIGPCLVVTPRLEAWLQGLKDAVVAADHARSQAATVAADALREVGCPDVWRRDVATTAWRWWTASTPSWSSRPTPASTSRHAAAVRTLSSPSWMPTPRGPSARARPSRSPVYRWRRSRP